MFLELNTRYHPDLVQMLLEACATAQCSVHIEYPPMGIEMWRYKEPQLANLAAELSKLADAYARRMCGRLHDQLEKIAQQSAKLGSVLFVRDDEGHAWLYGGTLQSQLNHIVWLPAESEYDGIHQLRARFVAKGEILRD